MNRRVRLVIAIAVVAALATPVNAQVNDGPPPHFPGDFSAFIGT
jgi:hypothetical protein